MIFSLPLRRDHLEALRDVRRLHVLDAGVEVLDVLADDDHVDALARVAGGDAGQLARGPDVGVGLEQLAQRDVGALLAEPDRRLEGALQDDPGPRDRVAGRLRHAGGVAALEDLGARLGRLPVDGDAGRGDDPLRGPDDLRADPVAGDDGDAVGLTWHGDGSPVRDLGDTRRGAWRVAGVSRILPHRGVARDAGGGGRGRAPLLSRRISAFGARIRPAAASNARS